MWMQRRCPLIPSHTLGLWSLCLCLICANQRWVTPVGRSGPPPASQLHWGAPFNQSAADGARGNRAPSSGPVPSCQTMIRASRPPDLITSITQKAEEQQHINQCTAEKRRRPLSVCWEGRSSFMPTHVWDSAVEKNNTESMERLGLEHTLPPPQTLIITLINSVRDQWR